MWCAYYRFAPAVYVHQILSYVRGTPSRTQAKMRSCLGTLSKTFFYTYLWLINLRQQILQTTVQ